MTLVDIYLTCIHKTSPLVSLHKTTQYQSNRTKNFHIKHFYFYLVKKKKKLTFISDISCGGNNIGIIKRLYSVKEIKESICTIGLNKESKFIEISTERDVVVFIMFSPGSLSVLLYPVTGDTVPYLKCSGGDYISHHNNFIMFKYLLNVINRKLNIQFNILIFVHTVDSRFLKNHW